MKTFSEEELTWLKALIVKKGGIDQKECPYGQ
jgi:hypothetical protein